MSGLPEDSNKVQEPVISDDREFRHSLPHCETRWYKRRSGDFEGPFCQERLDILKRRTKYPPQEDILKHMNQRFTTPVNLGKLLPYWLDKVVQSAVR